MPRTPKPSSHAWSSGSLGASGSLGLPANFTSVEELALAIGGTLAAASKHDSDRTASRDAVVRGITHDSRCVTPGVLFCCVVGENHDGHRFADQALSAGASALLVSRFLAVDAPQIVVSDVRAALGPASAIVWGQPWHRCRVVGVTGTAGKTTVTHAIASIARACGTTCEVIGTLDGTYTTPEAPDLCRRLSQAADAGTEMVVMEASSHALAMGRLDGANFAAGVFTNLSHEHLDFHVSMENYFAAKARLFDGRSEIAVLNVADAWGRRLSSMVSDRAAQRATRSATSSPIPVVEWRPTDLDPVAVSARGFKGQWRGRAVRCGLLGRVNATNVAAAAATASALGYDDDRIAAALADISPVRGRLWPVSSSADDVTVLVDYAHKPAALNATLASARELAAEKAQVWAVFGAGGDRDRSKRALMGTAASRNADMLVVTSDNPRSEDPAQIAADVVAGVDPLRHSEDRLRIELERSSAIAFAVANAQAGDVVVIAGKGHETEQVIAERLVPFDDAAVAAEHLRVRRSALQ